MKRLLTICAAALIGAGCSKPSDEPTQPETLTRQFDESEMNSAMATARSRVDEFLTVLSTNEADSFSVKAPINDGEETEHFWIVNVSYKDGVFSGEIGNDAGVVTNVKAGQRWEIKKGDISDWMFTKGDRIHGGFTIDPLLNSFPKDRADELRVKLVR